MPDARRAHAPARARPRGWRRPTTSTAAAKASPLWAKYGEPVDAQSAREMLAGRLADAGAERRGRAASPTCARRWSTSPPRAAPPRAGTRGTGADAVGDFLRSRQGKDLQRKVTRGILGMLRKRI